MGLGPLATVSLADARASAKAAREKQLSGIDPIDEREARRAAGIIGGLTFSECVTQHLKSLSPGWRNAKHSKQWQATLDTYAKPVIGGLPVQVVDTSHILKILEPIWTAKPETAKRLRGRIESVLDWATVRSFRRGENPARWKGHLSKLLPAISRVRQVQHHPALPYTQVGRFMEELGELEGTSARAFEFLILTCTRTSETIGARWPEIDFDQRMWVIPSERIKAGKEHRVPLSVPAIDALKKMRKVAIDDFVFPGGKKGKHLSNMALLALLKRIDRTDITAHGFRSTFRDWAAERTNYPRDVAEMALAHAIPDRVEAAYRRGDLFQKRRKLAEDWGKFCMTVAIPAKVIPMRSR